MGFIKRKSCKTIYPRTCTWIIQKTDLIRGIKLTEVDSRTELFLLKQHGDHCPGGEKKTCQASPALLFNGQMIALIHLLSIKQEQSKSKFHSFLPPCVYAEPQLLQNNCTVLLWIPRTCLSVLKSKVRQLPCGGHSLSPLPTPSLLSKNSDPEPVGIGWGNKLK